jgi:hypothetical protein
MSESNYLNDEPRDLDPLEREFIQSWDQVQQFYRSHYNSRLQGIVLLFIAVLRKAGYDRKLRAGQSMYSLILSRSRRSGLCAKQSFVRFEFHGVTMGVFSTGENGQEETVSGIPIALFGPIKKALENLSIQPLS